ncbi:SDR family oxidoreductase [Verrucomicrobia bacterium]|nr:SDR family oxidoreductase [Verrucomicrobiota bacterium]MDB4746588.1 SDR family oxidoreductase [Verrucomicrobiota bacterium]
MEKTLIIGASSDIGRALLSSLNSSDTHVIAHYNSGRKKLDEIASAFTGTLSLVGADLSSEAETRRLINEIRNETISKVIFLSAPRVAGTRFKSLLWEQFEQQLSVQLRASVMILKALLPSMAKRKQGKVVFMSTSYTHGVPPSYLAHYISAKYALLGLAKALAAEYATKNIQINSVAPSMVETGYLEALDDRIVEMNAESHPLKRNAVPDDIIPLIRFLTSSGSDYMNGVNIPVAGGQVF